MIKHHALHYTIKHHQLFIKTTVMHTQFIFLDTNCRLTYILKRGAQLVAILTIFVKGLTFRFRKMQNLLFKVIIFELNINQLKRFEKNRITRPTAEYQKIALFLWSEI